MSAVIFRGMTLHAQGRQVEQDSTLAVPANGDLRPGCLAWGLICNARLASSAALATAGGVSRADADLGATIVLALPPPWAGRWLPVKLCTAAASETLILRTVDPYFEAQRHWLHAWQACLGTHVTMREALL